MVNDLFQRDPVIAELLDRIEALEAVVYQSQKAERVKADEPLNEAWQKWNRYRNGKGWTAEAKKLSMKTLRELAGSDGALAVAIVHQSIERGWTGLFPLKSRNDMPSSTRSMNSAPSAVHMKTVAEALAPTETKEEAQRAWEAQQRHLGLMR